MFVINSRMGPENVRRMGRVYQIGALWVVDGRPGMVGYRDSHSPNRWATNVFICFVEVASFK